MYYNERTDEIITEEQFKKIAKQHIESNEWEDGGKPSVTEIMINMDWIRELES